MSNGFVARIEIIVVREGSGPEDSRKKVATFRSPDKLRALLDDRGILGGVLSGLLRDEFPDVPRG